MLIERNFLKKVLMQLNKIKDISNCTVNIIKDNYPGIYFLFDKDKKLIYIGESKFPLIRILDHYHKHYKIEKVGWRSGFQQKGIGPVFHYFRTMHVQSEDSRIRQHYEKRWIRKFDPPLNYNTRALAYDLSWKEINSFIHVYESFFKTQMTWYRYLNDEVCAKRDSYITLKARKRKLRYAATGR